MPPVTAATLARMETDLVLVLATVTLPDGIRPGKHYWVDQNQPYIARAIRGGILVPVPAERLGDLVDPVDEEEPDGVPEDLIVLPLPTIGEDPCAA